MRRAALPGLVAAALSVSAAHAQSVLQAPSPPRGPANALVAALDNVGLTQCRSALLRLSDLALQGARAHDVLLDWDRKNKSGSAVFTLIGLDFPTGGASMSISAIPGENGACTVNAERTSAAPVACALLAQHELAGYRATPLLPNFTVYVSPQDDAGSTVSLIDAPPGCLVIRRYVAFNATPPPLRPAAPAPAPPRSGTR